MSKESAELNSVFEKIAVDLLDRDYDLWSPMFMPLGTARQQKWMCGDGWFVAYTTERVKGGPFDGRFAVLLYKPIGKGARGGPRKAQEWKLVYKRGFSKRKLARARAEALWFQHKAR